MNGRRVIVLAPHGGDGEYGAGGLIQRLVEEKSAVYEAVFSLPRKGLPEHVTLQALQDEVRASAGVLGVQQEQILFFDYEVREFPRMRQSILEELVRLNREIRPDMVIGPSRYDTHQDHAVIAGEACRAFKACSILGYEVPRNNYQFGGSAFVVLQMRHMEMKRHALGCYRSQKEKFDRAARLREHLAQVRGAQVDEAYAECYEIIRWVI